MYSEDFDIQGTCHEAATRRELVGLEGPSGEVGEEMIRRLAATGHYEVLEFTSRIPPVLTVKEVKRAFDADVSVNTDGKLQGSFSVKQPFAFQRHLLADTQFKVLKDAFRCSFRLSKSDTSGARAIEAFHGVGDDRRRLAMNIERSGVSLQRSAGPLSVALSLERRSVSLQGNPNLCRDVVKPAPFRGLMSADRVLHLPLLGRCSASVEISTERTLKSHAFSRRQWDFGRFKVDLSTSLGAILSKTAVPNCDRFFLGGLNGPFSFPGFPASSLGALPCRTFVGATPGPLRRLQSLFGATTNDISSDPHNCRGADRFTVVSANIAVPAPTGDALEVFAGCTAGLVGSPGTDMRERASCSLGFRLGTASSQLELALSKVLKGDPDEGASVFQIGMRM
ncbi:MAG: hypothetical protein KVP17_001496 [Porospora cf. gigantea B]|uniref:uncharacterized protein n=2 Tax=Porospora cf. gigantea B TaxID=2853592 RepID=UPI003571A4CC|nr:MAG: hypothetical protein KVP17_001496 [Porospora cf. gigantea B]